MKTTKDTFAPAKLILVDQTPLAVLRGFGVSGMDSVFHAVATKKNSGIEAVEFVIFAKRLHALVLPFYKEVDLAIHVYSKVALVPDVVASDLCKKERMADQFRLDAGCVPLGVFKKVFEKSYCVVMTMKPVLDRPEFKHSFAQIQWSQRRSGTITFYAQEYSQSPIRGFIETLYQQMFFVKGQPPNANCDVQFGIKAWIDATS